MTRSWSAGCHLCVPATLLTSAAEQKSNYSLFYLQLRRLCRAVEEGFAWASFLWNRGDCPAVIHEKIKATPSCRNWKPLKVRLIFFLSGIEKVKSLLVSLKNDKLLLRRTATVPPVRVYVCAHKGVCEDAQVWMIVCM